MKKYIALGCLLTAFNLFCADYSKVDTVNIKNNAEATVTLHLGIRQSSTHIKHDYNPLQQGQTYGPITRSQLASLGFTVPSSYYPKHEYTVDLTQPGSLLITLNPTYTGYDSKVETVQPPTPPIRTQAYIPQTPLMQPLAVTFMALHKNSTAPEIKRLLGAGLSIDEIARIHPYLLLGFSTAAHNKDEARKVYDDLKTKLQDNAAGLRLLQIAYYHMPSVMIGLGNQIVTNPTIIGGIKQIFPDESEYKRYLAMITSATQQQREQEKEQTTPPPLPSRPVIQQSTTATPPPLPPRPSSKPAEKISSTALQQQIDKLKPTPQETQPTKPSKSVGRFNPAELQQQKETLRKPKPLQPAPAKELSLKEMLEKGMAEKFKGAQDSDEEQDDDNDWED